MDTQTQSPPQLAGQGPTHLAIGSSIITDLDIYKVVSSLRESLKDEIQAMVNIAIKQEVKPLLTKISELKSRIHILSRRWMPAISTAEGTVSRLVTLMSTQVRIQTPLPSK